MRLTRDQVVAGGLDLLDEVGLDKLTMRRLAAALGVQNGATYWHFSSKQALLEAMADRMLEGVTSAVDPGLPWDARVAETAHRLRGALLARRDGARLFAGVFFPLPNALAYGDAMTATLREAGLALRDAVWAVDALTYYVVGHATEEQLAAALPDGGRSAVARLRSALDPDRHPALHAAAGDVAAPHPQEHFGYGLELLLSGIRARLAGPVP
ncbi:TetR/AcrR family transcriptional regulator C-terminal domain-containing protein [Actinoallomurus sp. NPDC052274]|uniref:TetR/AcrR family transcriptional regulator C-terminal domain-containing protein n=1 Tax=Actinoallomurus sp. NPDC052274 TaxID=3155420 RepID=UPI00342B4591